MHLQNNTPDNPYTIPPEQLDLPIQFAPPVVREYGLQEAHAFPYVSRGKGHAIARKPARIAWRYQEIELRTPNSYPALILDVDTTVERCLDVALGSAAVRVPNWIASNPATGHAHVVYTLARLVLYGEGMRLAPLAISRPHCRILQGRIQRGPGLYGGADAQPDARQVGNIMATGNAVDTSRTRRAYSEALAHPDEADNPGRSQRHPIPGSYALVWTPVELGSIHRPGRRVGVG